MFTFLDYRKRGVIFDELFWHQFCRIREMPLLSWESKGLAYKNKLFTNNRLKTKWWPPSWLAYSLFHALWLTDTTPIYLDWWTRPRPQEDIFCEAKTRGWRVFRIRSKHQKGTACSSFCSITTDGIQTATSETASNNPCCQQFVQFCLLLFT